MSRFILCTAAICLTVSSLISCSSRLTSVTRTRIELGTYVKITIITTRKQEKEAIETIEKGFNRIGALDRLFDYRKEGGELWSFNRQKLFLRESDEELFKLIEYSLDVASATDGFFDPTILPIVALWGFDTDSPRLPTRHEIAHALELVGYRKVTVFEDRIEKPEDVELDLSGIAKGRIVDLVRDDLRSEGYGNFLIDAGGDIYVSGKNVHRRHWRIAIQDPDDQSSFRGIVEATDTAIVTSGNYEHFFFEDGVRYSHLFNPRTGYPEGDLKSVTVLLYDTTFADAVATAVFVMGSKRGYEFLIDNGIEGYLIYTDTEGSTVTMNTPKFWK
jgi:thiamine biosynthesis lipoprotein